MNRYVAIAALSTVLLLAGCTAAEPPAPPAPTVEEAGPAETPTSTPTPTPTVEKSPRGNLVKHVGDSFGTYDPDTKDQLATFRITGITVDPDCTGEYAEDPENGNFVRLDVEGEVIAGGEAFFFGSWKVIAENGTTFNGNTETGAAWSCIPDAQRLPSLVGVGERVAGSVILDVPTASGVIVLPIDGVNGWEWAYPE